MTPTKGTIITFKPGHKRKVLAVVDDCVLLSDEKNHKRVGYWSTTSELVVFGATWEQEKWEPEIGDKYWYINAGGGVGWSIWSNDKSDNSRRDFLGVYPTKEDAEQALAEIKKKLV